MEEKSFLSRILEKKGLLLILGSILVLPIIYFAASNRTGLFSRASDPSSNFTVYQKDPQTGEYFDLFIGAYPFSIVVENNISNKANITFRINGHNPRLVVKQTLFGGHQKPETTEYTKTFNFKLEGTGTNISYISDPVELTDNGCIDLHNDEARTQSSYVGTFCYKLSFFNRPNPQARIYSYSANPFIEVNYIGTKPSAVLSMTTAFDKYTSTRAPHYTGGSFKGSRVNYFSVNDGANTRDFTNLVYTIQGLTQGLTESQRAELCTIDPKYPEKYLRYGRSFWYEGGDLIELKDGNAGNCSFTTSQHLFINGWMNLWTQNMFPQPNNVTPTIQQKFTPTPTRLPSSSPTGTSTLCVPTQISPINNQVVNNLYPTLTWKACNSTAPLYYKIFITGPGVGGGPNASQATSVHLTQYNFQPGARYAWIVRSCTTPVCSQASAWSAYQYFTIGTPTTAPSGTVTKTISVTPTRPPITATRTPTPIVQKRWTINVVAECPAGRRLKPNFKPAWYWWDNVDGTDADVSTVALVSGPSNRTYYFTMFDSAGSVRAKSAPAGITVRSQYVGWSGSLPTGTYTIRFTARSSSCIAQ